MSPEGGVTVEPQVSNTQRGDSVTLSCTVLGGPRNAISWLHPPSDQELSSEPSLSVSVSGGGDGGLYTCSAANEAGNGSADATINGRYRENVCFIDCKRVLWALLSPLKGNCHSDAHKPSRDSSQSFTSRIFIL